jgi:hypothetical protein
MFTLYPVSPLIGVLCAAEKRQARGLSGQSVGASLPLNVNVNLATLRLAGS